jgi:uncharacterized protein (TIGR02996 family)
MKLYGVKKGYTTTVTIELVGKKLTTSTARLYDSKAKTTSKTYATPAKAKEAHDKLVAKHRAENFAVLGEMPAPVVPIARDANLEAELRKNRDDPAPYLVYADWLQGHGSPFGELLVLAQRTKKKAANAIAKKIGLPNEKMATMGWRHGMWQWLKLDNHVDSMAADFDAVAFAKLLFASPLCAALEELRIGMLRWEFADQPEVIAEAGKQAWAKDLLHLRVGDVDEDIDMDHHGVGVIGKAITKAFPKLQTLFIHSGATYMDNLGFDGLDLPDLTELTIETCSMSRKRMKSVAAAKLPKLEKLELWFGSRERANATIADVVPIWAGPAFPKVRHLGLCNTELVTDIVRLLPGSELAKQLETLDLSKGTFGDDDAQELIENIGKFPKLTTLNVSRSWLTAAGVRALKAALKGKKLIAGDQQDPEDWGFDEDEERVRYVAVSE